MIDHIWPQNLGAKIAADVSLTVVLCAVLGYGFIFVRHFHDILNRASVYKVPVGTCLKETYPESTAIRESCRDPHGSEVVGIVKDPSPRNAQYLPGFGMNVAALDECQPAYLAYVGPAAEESALLTYYAQYPSEGEWYRGARTIACFAIGREEQPLVGSVRGTAPAAPTTSA